jgi:hypothetical protein
MRLEINESDEISRCIIYDRAFDHDVHVDEHLWRFDSTSRESAVLRRLAPNAEDVHEIGCGIAAHQNERKGNPSPGNSRRYYCGFRTASVASLPTAGDGYSIAITHSPEGGVDAHVDVALTIFVEGKNARAVRRTDAGLAMAEQFGPPEPYICDCDRGDNHHPIARWGTECLTGGINGRWPGLVLPLTEDPAAANDDGLPQLPHIEDLNSRAP